MKQIVSDIVYIDKTDKPDSNEIEHVLADKFGDVIRWAIIGITQDKLKICLSYIKS